MTNTMNAVKEIRLYDNEYIRYKVDGQDHALLIHQDDDPFLNPRQAALLTSRSRARMKYFC